MYVFQGDTVKCDRVKYKISNWHMETQNRIVIDNRVVIMGCCWPLEEIYLVMELIIRQLNTACDLASEIQLRLK